MVQCISVFQKINFGITPMYDTQSDKNAANINYKTTSNYIVLACFI